MDWPKGLRAGEDNLQGSEHFSNAWLFNIAVLNDITATTIQENEENECIKLAVIFCCKFLCCWADVIHIKILFNMDIKFKVLKKGS